MTVRINIAPTAGGKPVSRYDYRIMWVSDPVSGELKDVRTGTATSAATFFVPFHRKYAVDISNIPELPGVTHTQWVPKSAAAVYGQTYFIKPDLKALEEPSPPSPQPRPPMGPIDIPKIQMIPKPTEGVPTFVWIAGGLVAAFVLLNVFGGKRG